MDNWGAFLNSGYCPADAVGNHPCYNGRLCDRCESSEADLRFKAWLDKNRKVGKK